VAWTASLSFLVAFKIEIPKIFMPVLFARNMQVHCHLSAQTVCPRIPRKPSDQGRITIELPFDTALLIEFYNSAKKSRLKG